MNGSQRSQLPRALRTPGAGADQSAAWGWPCGRLLLSGPWKQRSPVRSLSRSLARLLAGSPAPSLRVRGGGRAPCRARRCRRRGSPRGPAGPGVTGRRRGAASPGDCAARAEAAAPPSGREELAPPTGARAAPRPPPHDPGPSSQPGRWVSALRGLPGRAASQGPSGLQAPACPAPARLRAAGAVHHGTCSFARTGPGGRQRKQALAGTVSRRTRSGGIQSTGGERRADGFYVCGVEAALRGPSDTRTEGERLPYPRVMPGRIPDLPSIPCAE